MSDRIVHHLGFAQITQKVMPNREVRTRMKLNGGPTTTITCMPDWKWEDGVPVQEGHFHKGLTEIYTVLEGWMAYVDIVVPAGYDIHVVNCLEMITFGPDKSHLILLGPNAIIQTTLIGTPIKNSDQGEQDWWSTGDLFSSVKFSSNFLEYTREWKR